LRLPGATVEYLGSGPFYVGAGAITVATSGDLNKVPWAVPPDYTQRLVVSGVQVAANSQVNFGFWPTGFGTPAQQPNVPVSFERRDQLGRTVVYQPQLIVERQADSSWRQGAGFWSFPAAGCFRLTVVGPGVDESIYLKLAH
jgi:hypothetical protein